ncbi:MAG: hypothetical protein JWP91_4649 [Fibrobacteres bacterium]|nr:hypothetical protein [Fibrobacterota bacterium]
MIGTTARAKRPGGQAFLTMALAAGGLHLLVFLAVTSARIGYRYELEWTEGSILVQVRQMMLGLPIYRAPAPEYVPYVYTPLYFYLGAAASAFGGGFLPLRLISLLSTLAGIALAYRWIRADTGRPAAAFLAAGLFAASFRPTGFWFDLARVDCLCLLLLLLGLRALSLNPRPLTAIAAALAFTLAFQTKQTSIAVIVAMLPYAVLKGLFRRGDGRIHQGKSFLAFFLLGTVLGVGGSIWFLGHIGRGWYGYYVLKVSSGHGAYPGVWLTFWTKDLIGQFGLALALAGFGLWRIFRAEGRYSDRGWFRACGSAGMIGSAWITRTHVGSWDNVLLPAFAWLALMAGWGVAETLPWRGWRGPLLGTLFLIQFAHLGYNPRSQIPDAADRAEGDALVRYISGIEGTVWVPDHEYLAEWAGKPTYANRMPMEDLRRGQGGGPGKAMEDSLRTLLRRKVFSALLLDTPDWSAAGFLPGETGEWYALADSLPLHGRAFFPKTGVKSRPLYLYRPIE